MVDDSLKMNIAGHIEDEYIRLCDLPIRACFRFWIGDGDCWMKIASTQPVEHADRHLQCSILRIETAVACNMSKDLRVVPIKATLHLVGRE